MAEIPGSFQCSNGYCAEAAERLRTISEELPKDKLVVSAIE